MAKEVKEQDTKVDISKYIVNVQGKDFVTFPGLLALAHEKGLTNTSTELVNSDLTNPVVKATVTLVQDGVTKTFTGYGDANANNVAKKVAGALLRMSETRAIARAFRFACNVDMAALEELGGEDDVINHQTKPSTTKQFNTPTKFGNTTSSISNVTVSETPVAATVTKPTFTKRATTQPST
jgi:hypothetical protein